MTPANYSRPSFRSCQKDEPRLVQRVEKRTRKASADKAAKAAVKKRDKGCCRVCGRKATEVHEALKFKSLGGVASLENSIAVCAEPKGRCHALLQQHGIAVLGEDCSKPLKFEMSQAVAHLVFRGKAVPKRVTVLK